MILVYLFQFYKVITYPVAMEIMKCFILFQIGQLSSIIVGVTFHCIIRIHVITCMLNIVKIVLIGWKWCMPHFEKISINVYIYFDVAQMLVLQKEEILFHIFHT